MSQRHSRRTFVKAIGAAGLSMPLIHPRLLRAESANGKVRIAFVATGGKGGVHVDAFKKLECPCYADVDTNQFTAPAKIWPNAKGYQDYRKMYEKHGKEFDAVAVATPDHNHFHAALYAMQIGKHVYCEKPLTHSVWEARMLTEAARKYKVKTQMGNQGHSMEGWRLFMEMVNAGHIGEITEVHTWTNRPIWPQGLSKPAGASPVPANLDWEQWIGPAPFRPYYNEAEETDAKGKKKKRQHGVYHQFSWRGRFDFGSGALGDMACHTTDGIQWLMDPDYPLSVEPVQVNGISDDCYPNSCAIKYSFGAKGKHGAWTHTWYEGGLRPEAPAELGDRKMSTSGNLVIGTKGKILITGDYGNSPRIIPESRHADLMKTPPAKLFPRVEKLDDIGGDLHHSDFIRAIRENKVAGSNFDYSGPFTEIVQLGNVALRAGKKIVVDQKTMKITNVSGLDHLIRREYRKGWEVTSI